VQKNGRNFIWTIGSFLRIFNFRRPSKIVRVTTKAVKRLAIKPIESVTAKPLIGPEPN